MTDNPEVSSTPSVIMESGKAPDFKSVFIDGAYTWLQPETGTLLFFYDVIEETTIDQAGRIFVTKTKRTYPFELRMRRSFYAALIGYMTEQLKNLENIEKANSEKKSN